MADARTIRAVMSRRADRLPAHSSNWRQAIDLLAGVVADAGAALTDAQQGVLVGAGALMLRQASIEDEARLLAASYFSSIKGGAR